MSGLGDEWRNNALSSVVGRWKGKGRRVLDDALIRFVCGRMVGEKGLARLQRLLPDAVLVSD